jgi:hypothetical protein
MFDLLGRQDATTKHVTTSNSQKLGIRDRAVPFTVFAAFAGSFQVSGTTPKAKPASISLAPRFE